MATGTAGQDATGSATGRATGDTVADRDRLRADAAAIVAEVAVRLADPARVVATASAPGNLLDLRSGQVPVWQPASLNDGHPGVGLLFAELATTDPGHRRVVHDHLARATGAALGGPPHLYRGALAVAFAAHAAATSGGYDRLLRELDGRLLTAVPAAAEATRARLAAGGSAGTSGAYDLVNGPVGAGRYLLARYERTRRSGHAEALVPVLRLLVATATASDRVVGDRRVPAWWTGRVDLGVAHGIGGPLALLALAHRAGVRVDGQAEAAERIVALLASRRREDAAGPWWPMWTSLDGEPDPRGRDAWCYGAAGVARVLDLAGAAFDRPRWRADARTALAAVLARADDDVPSLDAGLCHGWAGLLRIASGLPGTPPGTLDALAARVVAAFDPAEPFGFSYGARLLPRTVHRPGFLDGAAGAALALDAWTRDRPPVTGWDAALLVS